MALRALSGEKLEKERERVAALKRYEAKLCREGGFSYIIGIDEVGRGPLCGPVVAAACILPEDCEILFLNDSKKLSEARREALYDEISEKALAFGIGQVDAPRIDEINILQATFEAMRAAAVQCLEMLQKKQGREQRRSQNQSRSQSHSRRLLPAEDCLVLVDGNKRIPELGLPQECIVKGDAAAASIAAASILAKVTRDRMMVEYDAVYPGYGFAKNKGYGTEEHYQGLRLHGITPIHRKTFLKNFSGVSPDASEHGTQNKTFQGNTREKGAYYETVAADFLKSRGYQIAAENYRCRAGELDLVALDGDTLCFIEVKYRKNADSGMPGEAVDERKQKRIAGAARTFIAQELVPGGSLVNREKHIEAFRFDVVEILGNQIRVIQNAFELSL